MEVDGGTQPRFIDAHDKPFKDSIHAASWFSEENAELSVRECENLHVSPASDPIRAVTLHGMNDLLATMCQPPE